MLDGIKRFFSSETPESKATDPLVRWAESRQFILRGVRESEGFVIEGRLGAAPWRLEWGPSQRSYLEGNELRLRAELGLPKDLQVMVLNRSLQEMLETAVFDQYVEGVQTRIDTETPPEMRWLVMFPKLEQAEMGHLHERFVAVSSIHDWLVQWLQGPLDTALGATNLGPNTPFVLMIGRGRLTLRTGLESPDVPDLEAWIRLFEVAMRESRRVGQNNADPSVPSTQPSMWSASALPPDDLLDKPPR
jgi:hypothetical protein